jgi:triacylglycerol lipase
MSWILFAGISVIGYKLLSDRISAWANVYSNELYTEVPPVIVDMEPPQVDVNDTYNPSLSLYTIDLIRRFSESIYLNHDMDTPRNLTTLGLIAYKKEEPSIAIVFVDPNNHAWIVVRGTHTTTDFRHDTMFHQLPMYRDKPYLKVHQGFHDIFSIIMPRIHTLFKYYGPIKSVTLTGHSMGAAVSTLIAYDLYEHNYDVNAYIYASPRTVNYEMANNIKFNIFRVDNTEDIVATKPPPLVISIDDVPNTYNHVGTPLYFTENRLSFEKNHTIPVYYDFIYDQFNLSTLECKKPL